MQADIFLILAGVTAFSAVLVFPLVLADRARNRRRTTCICCGAKLTRPGGVSIFLVGPGFCSPCRDAVLRRTR